MEKSQTNEYIGNQAKIIEVKKLTPIENLYTLRFVSEEIGDSFTFRPGQFVMFGAPGIGEFPVSICSSPTRKGYFQLCIRKAGKVTNYVHEHVVEGSVVYIRGPYGNGFPLDLMKGHSVILVAGGLGMAPLRSILQYHIDTWDFEDLYLFYGVKSYDFMLFREEILWLLERGKEINVHVFLSFERVNMQAREIMKKNPQNTTIGVVTDILEKARDIVPFEKSYVMICGPPIMYKYVTKKLLELNTSPGKMYMTLERRMKCGIGKCGHCIVGTSTSIKYVCLDGPVFTYWDVLSTKGLIE